MTRNIERIAVLSLAIGSFLLLIAFVLYSEQHRAHQIIEIVPALTNQPERCLSCHNGIEPISASHPTDKFGCVSCHAGDAQALTIPAAHSGLIRNPGSLQYAEKYCGSCHAAQTAVVPRNIMATYSGAIGLVRRSFGLQKDGTARYASTTIDHLQAFKATPDDPPPVQQFAQRCLTCHLNSEPIKEPHFYRSTGCSACHVLYSNSGLYEGSDPAIPKNQPNYPIRHQITKAIPYTQCNHCHNQGNYDLRSMTFLRRPDMPPPANLTGDALRLHDYYQPIGLFTKCEYELDCVDCHTKTEIMGDGFLHDNKAQAQYIQCQTCHGTTTSLPLETVYINPATGRSETVLMSPKGEALATVVKQQNKWYQTFKVTGQRREIPLVMGSKCEQKPDQQTSNYCHECHAIDRAAVLSSFK